MKVLHLHGGTCRTSHEEEGDEGHDEVRSGPGIAGHPIDQRPVFFALGSGSKGQMEPNESAMADATRRACAFFSQPLRHLQ